MFYCNFIIFADLSFFYFQGFFKLVMPDVDKVFTGDSGGGEKYFCAITVGTTALSATAPTITLY